MEAIMLFFFKAGGPYMWLLLLLSITVVVLALKKAKELFSPNITANAKLEHGINAILFWGIMSFVIGIFAHFVGIYMAMQAIMMANDISPAIVAGGYAVSLITILSGLFIMMLSSILWFFLRWKYKSVVSKS
jgi:biopolymer transport protein ExbB/TolQ